MDIVQNQPSLLSLGDPMLDKASTNTSSPLGDVTTSPNVNKVDDVFLEPN